MDIVILRKFQDNDEVLAVLPEFKSVTPGTYMSYLVVGQHGECSIDLESYTVPATLEEGADVMADLVSVGYDPYALSMDEWNEHRYEKMISRIEMGKFNTN